MFVIEEAQAVYCANPDLVEGCIKICAAADVSAIGLRLGSYLQAVAFFILVIVAPDEGGSEALWIGLSISFAFIATVFVQMYQGAITMHHTVVVLLLSNLPYLATLAGMNSLSSYRVLGSKGMIILQVGLITKAVFTAFLWGCCLYAWFEGQLPDSLHLYFRQPDCLESTAIVSFFVPARRSDENYEQSKGLVIAYTVFWFLVLLAGSYWSIRAPIVLRRRGGHFKPAPTKKNMTPKERQKFFMTPEQRENAKQDARAKQKRPEDYDPSTSEDDQDLMSMTLMRSLPKASVPITFYPPPPERDMDNARLSITSLRTPEEASLEWSSREIASRHHFIIWPIAAVLLTFGVLSTELQIGMNDIYVGEMHWDFPGTLTLLLAVPTAWTVIKACRRIIQGRRPTPAHQVDETFMHLSHNGGGSLRSRATGSSRQRFISTASSDSESEPIQRLARPSSKKKRSSSRRV